MFSAALTRRLVAGDGCHVACWVREVRAGRRMGSKAWPNVSTNDDRHRCTRSGRHARQGSAEVTAAKLRAPVGKRAFEPAA